MHSFEDLRKLEKDSIWSFLWEHRNYLHGRVLDYGCGRMPYVGLITSPLVETYTPYDRIAFPGSCAEEDLGPDYPLIELKWNSIVATQMLQYVANVSLLLAQFYDALEMDGILMLTYATNWPEVESTDFWRFTRAGIQKLLSESGFQIQVHEPRAIISEYDYGFVTGHGVVAKK